MQNTYNIKTCGNLRKDVKGFVSGVPIGGPLYGPFVDFDLILVVNDSIMSNFSDDLFLRWDTTDFKSQNKVFENDSFRLWRLTIIPFDGYFEAIDGTEEYTIYSDSFNTVDSSYTQSSFSTDSILVMPLWLSCDTLNQNSNVMRVKLRLLFRSKTLILSIGEYDINPSFVLYPNPSTGRFQIEFEEFFDGVVEIFDIAGKSIYSENIKSQKTAITVDDKGVYLLMATNKQGKFYTKKVIIY